MFETLQNFEQGLTVIPAGANAPTFAVDKYGNVNIAGALTAADIVIVTESATNFTVTNVLTLTAGDIDGTAGGEIAVNEAGADVDFRHESDANTTHFVSNAGAFGGRGAFGFGGDNTGLGPAITSFFIIDQPASLSAVANSNYFRFMVSDSLAVTIPTGTAAVAATAAFLEPNLTATGTVSDAYTVYIPDGPTEGTRNGALWVAAGTSRFSGRVNPAQGADIPSAGDLTLGADGNFFAITGTTTVNGIAIAGWVAGAIVVLKATGSQTWANNASPGAGFGKLQLVGAANVSMTANDLMILVFNGTDWEQAAPTLVK